MRKTQEKVFDPAKAIYTPAEVSTYGLQQIRQIQAQENKALKMFIPGVDAYFAPVLPGQIVAVIAQTSNYKSGFAHAWEYAAARQLEAEGRTDEVVVHVSVEEVVEEQAFLMFARETGESAGRLAKGEVQDWSRLDQAAIRVGTIPIYRIGDSLARAEDFPNLYLSNMIRSILYLRDHLLEKQLKIGAVFFDYLQAFPIDPEVSTQGMESQRRLQVISDVNRLMQYARFLAIPFVVMVQAKQILDGAPSKKHYIPGIYDGQESAIIGQRFDRIIQLWLPKMNWPVGDWLEYKDLNYTVEENILWIKVGKQRGGLPSGKAWKCRIDYATNQILPEPMPGVDPFQPTSIQPGNNGNGFKITKKL